MKVVKIVFISIGALLAVAALGLYFFLKSVDINKYIPQIAQEVKKTIGRDLVVSRADLNLSFDGASFEARGVSLSDDTKFSSKPFLLINRVRIGVDLKAFIFSHKIQVTEVNLFEPKVTIIRNKDGQLNVQSLMPALPSKNADAQAKKEAASASSAALPLVLVDSLEVSNAELSYIDETFSPQLALALKKTNISLHGFSLTDAFHYTLKAALFSDPQNIDLAGTATLDLASLSLMIQELKIDADFDKFNLSELEAALPMIQPAGLKELKGKLDILVAKAKAGADGLLSLKAEATLKDGQVLSSLLPLPVTQIGVNTKADEKNASITMTAMFSGGQIKEQGILENFLTVPSMSGTFSGQDIELEAVTQAYKLPAKATGKASFDGKFSFSGKAPQDILASFKSDMTFGLKNGVVEGENLVKASLSNIPLLPNLWDTIQPSLSTQTQEDAKKGVTVIEQCDGAANMNATEITLSRFELVTRDIVLNASGSVPLASSMNIKADILIQKQLAAVLIAKAPDLNGLKEDTGTLRIPVSVSGLLLQPQVHPDVEYLTKKIVANRGQAELEKALKKNPQVQGVFNALFGSGETSSSAGAQDNAPSSQTQQPQQPVATQKAVGALFNAIFDKKK
ncbi:MAG: AsmA family protein [Candidatus Omnitrophica bacterium]|nr:AsmA family protein [Candidatus Omnitrophota bacterium]